MSESYQKIIELENKTKLVLDHIKNIFRGIIKIKDYDYELKRLDEELTKIIISLDCIKVNKSTRIKRKETVLFVQSILGMVSLLS